MTTLFTSRYKDKDPARQDELDACLHYNLWNPLIDHVVLLADDPNATWPEDEKLTVYTIDHRATFNDFFEVMRLEQSDIMIIANSDIYFNETLAHASRMQNIECYGLSRWDVDLEGNLTHYNRPDSQDVWVFKVVPDIDAPFSLGIPGCDNRIAHEIHKVGYTITNPSLIIQALHLHNTGVRNYTSKDTVPPPYKLLPACTIN